MKKVLMVVYSFPPLVNPGAERAVSFVRQLHNYGWEPVVLTREAASGSSVKLEASIPEGIDVIRTKPWVPSNLPQFIRILAEFFSSLLIPDKERLWELSSARKAARVVKNNGVDLVYTISPPSSAHLLGLHLKKKYPRVPWIADLCTLQTTGHNNSAISASHILSHSVKVNYEKKLLGRIAEHADCIITGDEAIHEGFLAIQKGKDLESTACIVPDGQVQELSRIFEKACRAIAARKLVNSQQ